MPQIHFAPFSRRSLLAAAGALGLGALVAGCTGRGGPGRERGDGWSFTDDRNTRVTADGRPTRVVAYIGAAAALHDFGVTDQIVGVFGPTRGKDGGPDPQAGDLDVNRVTVLGNTYGEFNLEKYAALQPDLLVTNMFQPGVLWYVPDASKDKVLEFAPSLAITATRVFLPEPVRRYAELAEALGADLKSEKVTAAKARFDSAGEALRTAVKERAGIKVMAASARTDMFYVSDPKVYADLSYFRDLGVEFVGPEKAEADGFWEPVSWENAHKYAADVILLDSRTGSLKPEDMASMPTWSQLPAARAGQVTPWQSEPRFSYQGAATALGSLTKAIRGAEKVA
ncbi:ABC transporter substrate-binding protein [Longimycelium tulufanense]|uniref:ABC transporter substrate-binding protein n=1 Tax=Longimycelium tulufanense TaxID=907463 RepID=A0A8J3CCS4_9PSEU|nr:ABC transporter substrate-binding protein [Longimycelium tulufanense]GGM49844.1 ABC transporter substrate-binding protein [Longimycelium tulufanense]